MHHHHPRPRRHPPSALKLARTLGWISLGLGVAEVLVPRQVGRQIGMADRESLLSLYGWREIAQGLGILLARDPSPWVWTRVVGDALDFGTLVSGSRARRRRMTFALAGLATITLMDLYCARRLTPLPVSDPQRLEDYRRRSGFPRSPDDMRGAVVNGSRAAAFPRQANPITRAAQGPGG